MSKNDTVNTNPAVVDVDGGMRVMRHKKATRRRHAAMIITTFALMMTGFSMWAGLSQMSGLVATIHAVLGLVFVGIPLLWLLTDFRHFSAFIGDITSFDKNDAGWIAHAGGYLGSEEKATETLPAQGKFNTGQKLTALLIVIVGIGLGITGPLMWLGSGEGFFGLFNIPMAPQLIWVLWRVHLILATVMLVLIAMHMFIVLLPRNVATVNSMFGDGTVDMEYAKKHHARWIEEDFGVVDDDK